MILMKMNTAIDLTLQAALVLPNWCRLKRTEEIVSKTTADMQ